jgi:hypothetical protein
MESKMDEVENVLFLNFFFELHNLSTFVKLIFSKKNNFDSEKVKKVKSK